MPEEVQKQLILLITAHTPEHRRMAHEEFLRRTYKEAGSRLQIITVDTDCQRPSKYADDTNTYLYADPSVFSLSDSLALARDAQTKWQVPAPLQVSERFPLAKCRKCPRRNPKRSNPSRKR